MDSPSVFYLWTFYHLCDSSKTFASIPSIRHTRTRVFLMGFKGDFILNTSGKKIRQSYTVCDFPTFFTAT